MTTKDPMYNDLIKEISKLPRGTRFEIGKLCRQNPSYNKAKMPELGKLFKSEVLAKKIPGVIFSSLESDNHNFYQKK